MSGKKNISFWGLLYIVIIALKITGYIIWSWWIVLLPFYLPVSLFIIILILGTIVLGPQKIIKIIKEHLG